MQNKNIKHLLRTISKKERLVIGLMSGTSVDGIDTIIVKIKNSGINTKFEVIAFKTYAFPKGLREFIIKCSSAGTVEQIYRLNFLLGKLFANAVKKITEETKIPLSEIDLIGSHGQTILHLPKPVNMFGESIKSTLQIGEPSVIAKETGIITVGDFRVGDVAVGGDGAPLVPYFDYIIFRSKKFGRILLNIGGISNITFIPKNSTEKDFFAFDTGPGNMLIDRLMKILFRKNYDKNGEIAKRGKISEKLLKYLMSHRFISKSPPKSTGREDFGEEFTQKILRKSRNLRLEKEDIISTVSEFTVKSIYENCKKFVFHRGNGNELIVSGGGAHNIFIMKRLENYFSGIKLRKIDEFGISSDEKEALCFAIFANETLSGHKTNVPQVTGANKKVILGKICLP